MTMLMTKKPNIYVFVHRRELLHISNFYKSPSKVPQNNKPPGGLIENLSCESIRIDEGNNRKNTIYTKAHTSLYIY